MPQLKRSGNGKFLGGFGTGVEAVPYAPEDT